MSAAIEAYRSMGGARIYRLPLEVFPGVLAYAHLLLFGEITALVDVGSGIDSSNAQLEAGLEAVREQHRERAQWSDITHILITHGHIDHFGGLGFVVDRTPARVGVHGLDFGVLTNYEERLSVVSSLLRAYLIEAGLAPDARDGLMDLYLLQKSLFTSARVDFTYESSGMQVGPLQLVHFPGHCPGQVVVFVDDILLSSDHVLLNTSPHVAPERLSPWTGLGHYLESLERLQGMSGRVRLSLGGHEGPIPDLAARIQDIMQVHHDRLKQVLLALDVPRTIKEVTDILFPEVLGYHVLLALEETGAHLEYLHQRGLIVIDNVGDLEGAGTVPLRYRRLPGSNAIRPWTEKGGPTAVH